MYVLKPTMMLASGLQTAWEQIDSMRKVPNNFRFYIVLDVEQRPWSFKVEVIMWYLRSYYKVKVSKIIIFYFTYITDDQGPAKFTTIKFKEKRAAYLETTYKKTSASR